MRADRENFFNLISDYNADCLRSLVISLHNELEEQKLRQSANEIIYTEAHIQYSELLKERDTLKKENGTLKEQLAKEIDKNILNTLFWFLRYISSFRACFLAESIIA